MSQHVTVTTVSIRDKTQQREKEKKHISIPTAPYQVIAENAHTRKPRLYESIMSILRTIPFHDIGRIYTTLAVHAVNRLGVVPIPNRYHSAADLIPDIELLPHNRQYQVFPRTARQTFLKADQ